MTPKKGEDNSLIESMCPRVKRESTRKSTQRYATFSSPRSTIQLTAQLLEDDCSMILIKFYLIYKKPIFCSFIQFNFCLSLLTISSYVFDEVFNEILTNKPSNDHFH